MSCRTAQWRSHVRVYCSVMRPISGSIDTLINKFRFWVIINRKQFKNSHCSQQNALFAAVYGLVELLLHIFFKYESGRNITVNGIRAMLMNFFYLKFKPAMNGFSRMVLFAIQRMQSFRWAADFIDLGMADWP